MLCAASRTHPHLIGAPSKHLTACTAADAIRGHWSLLPRDLATSAPKPAPRLPTRPHPPLPPAPTRSSGSGATTASRAAAFDYYRAFQKVFVDRTSGDVVLRFHRTDVVRVKPNGDVLMTTGGYYTP
jgi:hypothetical protein